MKKKVTLMALSIMSSGLISASAAWGASLTADSVKGSNNQILTEVTTVAGKGDFGMANGDASAALFRNPSGVVMLGDGSVLIADTRNHLIRSLKDGQVATYAGLSLKKDSKGFPIGGIYNGTRDQSFFQNPAGLAADGKGNIIVADAGNNAVRKIDAEGKVTTIAGTGIIGIKDGAGDEATFNAPSDVAVAADGTIYVADTLNHSIRSIMPNGQVAALNALSGRLIEVTPGQVVSAGDFADGSLANAKFNEPTGLALDGKGNLYVSDSGNQRIRYIDFKQGTVTTAAGSSMNEEKTGLYKKNGLYAPGDFADGAANTALFHNPQGIAVTEEGGLLIADSLNHSVRYLFNGQVTTIAGSADLRGGAADGPDRGAQLKNPTDVAVAADGTVVVADSFNNKIRKIALYQLPANLPKDDSVKVVYASQWIEFDTQPEIANGRTMVPIRAIAETLGYKVIFNDEARSVQLSKEGLQIELYLDKTGIKRSVKDKPAVDKQTDIAPYIKDDRTYVPVRFFAEEIGLNVQWDDTTRTVMLR